MSQLLLTREINSFTAHGLTAVRAHAKHRSQNSILISRQCEIAVLHADGKNFTTAAIVRPERAVRHDSAVIGNLRIQRKVKNVLENTHCIVIAIL